MPPAVASSTRIERVALPDGPSANEPHIHDGPSTWTISERYPILEGHKHLMGELDDDEEHIDFGELSIRIPGHSKNDCIEYFDSNMAAFGCQGEDLEPFDESTAPVSGTRLVKRKAEDGEEELSIDKQLKLCQEELKKAKLELQSEKEKGQRKDAVAKGS